MILTNAKPEYASVLSSLRKCKPFRKIADKISSRVEMSEEEKRKFLRVEAIALLGSELEIQRRQSLLTAQLTFDDKQFRFREAGWLTLMLNKLYPGFVRAAKANHHYHYHHASSSSSSADSQQQETSVVEIIIDPEVKIPSC